MYNLLCDNISKFEKKNRWTFQLGCKFLIDNYKYVFRQRNASGWVNVEALKTDGIKWDFKKR